MSHVAIQQYYLRVPSSCMRAAPDNDAECTNECLFGERVERMEHDPNELPAVEQLTDNAEDLSQHDRWLLVRACRDNYCGYIHRSHIHAVDTTTANVTHRVATRSTLVFSAASIKSRVVSRLPFLAHISANGEPGTHFTRLATGGFIWSEHLMKIDSNWQGTTLQLAKSHFLGAPYLWGGCTPQGLDCSGLVQALANAKGLDIPRDSIDQEKALTHTIEPGWQRAEDIVYWPGHTGILVDPDTLLHATAHSLSCLIEPLDKVIDRAGDISSIKRLFNERNNH